MLIVNDHRRSRSHDLDMAEISSGASDGIYQIESSSFLERRLSAYPDDPLIDQPYRDSENKWRIFVHIIFIGYMLLGLNTVCDIYFTGSLEVMVDNWNIKPDVAGATFMAAGGSAPELFTSLIGACITTNDVGFGTIVGSAVFNVLFVIGLCGFAATTPIRLTWWPLFRDCTYYIFGLCLLAIFASDEQIRFWEAAVLFIAYVLYCVLMYNNPRLEALTDSEYLRAKKKRFSETDCTPTAKNQVQPDLGGTDGEISDDSIEKITIPGSSESPNPKTVTPVPETSSAADDGETSEHMKSMNKRLSHLHGKVRVSAFIGQGAAERHNHRMASVTESASMSDETKEGEEGEAGGATDDEEGDLMTKPEGGKDLLIWYLSLPVYAPLHYTIPQPSDKFFIVTFILSLVWIAVFSFVLVFLVEVLGEVCHIPSIIMGFTLLAAGTSIPDAVSSVAVARMGEGDMAVSSSIGSNIFDILIGLPVPWMIKIGIIDKGESTIAILSPYLTFYVILLLFMVFMVVASIHTLGWVLNKTLGIFMAFLYLIFLFVAVSVESLQPTWLKF